MPRSRAAAQSATRRRPKMAYDRAAAIVARASTPSDGASVDDALPAVALAVAFARVDGYSARELAKAADVVRGDAAFALAVGVDAAHRGHTLAPHVGRAAR